MKKTFLTTISLKKSLFLLTGIALADSSFGQASRLENSFKESMGKSSFFKPSELVGQWQCVRNYPGNPNKKKAPSTRKRTFEIYPDVLKASELGAVERSLYNSLSVYDKKFDIRTFSTQPVFLVESSENNFQTSIASCGVKVSNGQSDRMVLEVSYGKRGEDKNPPSLCFGRNLVSGYEECTRVESSLDKLETFDGMVSARIKEASLDPDAQTEISNSDEINSKLEFEVLEVGKIYLDLSYIDGQYRVTKKIGHTMESSVTLLAGNVEDYINIHDLSLPRNNDTASDLGGTLLEVKVGQGNIAYFLTNGQQITSIPNQNGKLDVISKSDLKRAAKSRPKGFMKSSRQYIGALEKGQKVSFPTRPNGSNLPELVKLTNYTARDIRTVIRASSKFSKNFKRLRKSEHGVGSTIECEAYRQDGQMICSYDYSIKRFYAER